LARLVLGRRDAGVLRGCRYHPPLNNRCLVGPAQHPLGDFCNNICRKYADPLADPTGELIPTTLFFVEGAFAARYTARMDRAKAAWTEAAKWVFWQPCK
jgi:hypothetical protein